MRENAEQELVEHSLATTGTTAPTTSGSNNNNTELPSTTTTNTTTKTPNRNTVQENLLKFLESKKYGAIYLQNEQGEDEDDEDDFLKSLENNSITASITPFEIKDKERLLDPYALTAKFTTKSGLPQVEFDENTADYYVPSSDDMTISEMSSTLGSSAKKTFLKAGVKGGKGSSASKKSNKSSKTDVSSGIADQMKLINSKAVGFLSNEANKEAKEAKSLFNLGALYSSPEERKYKKSEEYFCKALNARLKVYGKNHFMTAEAYEKLGDVLVLLEDSNTARMYYSEALQSISNVDVDDETYDDCKELEQRVRKSLTCMPLTSNRDRDPNEHATIWESVVNSS